MSRNYTAGERAVALIGIAAGRSLAEVNAVLEADAKRHGGGFRAIPASSFAMLARYPVVGTHASWLAMWEHITAPKSLGDHATENTP